MHLESISHYLGLDDYRLRQKNENFAVYYEPDKLINAHMLLCGMSGTGKSFQTLRMLESAAKTGVQVDVFDVHDELSNIKNASVCLYSQYTAYGYNPLVLETDAHTGGVNRQVDFIVNLIRKATPQFGAKQEAALRYLLIDTYYASGISQKDTNSWHRKKITEQQRQKIIEQRQWSQLREYYPTMDDLRSYAKRKITTLMMGGDNKSVTALDHLCRSKSRLHSCLTKASKSVTDDDIAKMQKMIEKNKNECIENYTNFVNAMQTGREIDDVLKYDSMDVLTSVIQRLDILNSAGIFSANEPDFGNSNVRVHQIKSLSSEQQILFVKLRLREIFEKYKRMGATKSGTEIRQIVFLDEAHKYFTDDNDDIVNIIAKEARKFGLGLWCASQQPTEFPESFLTNVGATVLLGIHASFWKRSANLLRISEESLKWIKPKEVMAIKLQKDGRADPPFVNIVVPNPNSAFGQRAASEYSQRS